MSETKKERELRIAQRLLVGRLDARETANDGHSVAAISAALRRGSTPEATKAIKPIVDRLVLNFD